MSAPLGHAIARHSIQLRRTATTGVRDVATCSNLLQYVDVFGNVAYAYYLASVQEKMMQQSKPCEVRVALSYGLIR
jgi:hypothetical protein